MYNKLELKLDILVPTIKCQGSNYCPCFYIKIPMNIIINFTIIIPINKASNYSIEIPICISL